MLDLELENIRAALAWGLESGQIDDGLAVAVSISRYWYLRSLNKEGAGWFEEYLPRAQSLTPRQLAKGLSASAATLLRLGRMDEVMEQSEQAYELLEPYEDHRNQGWAMYYRAAASYGREPLDETEQMFLRALEHFEAATYAPGIGLTRLLLLTVLVPRDAKTGFQAALDVETMMTRAGSPNGIAHAQEIAAGAATRLGMKDDARRLLLMAIDVYREIGNQACHAHFLISVAGFLEAAGRPVEAAHFVGAGAQLRRNLATIVAPYEEFLFAGVEDRLLAALGDETYRKATRVGHGWPRQTILDRARDAVAGDVRTADRRPPGQNPGGRS